MMSSCPAAAKGRAKAIWDEGPRNHRSGGHSSDPSGHGAFGSDSLQPSILRWRCPTARLECSARRSLRRRVHPGRRRLRGTARRLRGGGSRRFGGSLRLRRQRRSDPGRVRVRLAVGLDRSRAVALRSTLPTRGRWLPDSEALRPSVLPRICKAGRRAPPPPEEENPDHRGRGAARAISPRAVTHGQDSGSQSSEPRIRRAGSGTPGANGGPRD